MKDKYNQIKIVGRIGSAIGQDLVKVASDIAQGTIGLTTLALGAASIFASLPLVGSLNNSLNRRIYSKLEEKTTGGKNEFINNLHGSEGASVANSASMLLMPIIYGAIGYQTAGGINTGRFIGMCGLGVIESFGRICLRNMNREERFYPGTIIGSTLGLIGEKSYDYLRNKYDKIKKEMLEEK